MFKVPIDINENSLCYMEENSGTAELIRNCKLIVLDEMTMCHKYVFECLDRSFRKIKKNDLLFGGISIIFTGDWR